MAIAYVSSASVLNSSSGSSIINVPSGTVDGYVMVAFVSVNNTTSTTTPTGWTLINSQLNGGISGRISLYFRVASSEPSNYTFTHSSTQRNGGWISTFAGVDTSSVTNGSSMTGASFTAPSITTTVANTMLVYGGYNDNAANTVFSAPGGMTMSVDTGGFGSVGGMYGVQSSAGATGTRTMAQAPPVLGASAMVALREATAPPSNTTNFFGFM